MSTISVTGSKECSRESLSKDDRPHDNTPADVTETVILKRPFGMRIHKVSLKITFVEPGGNAMGLVGVGDEIVAINKKQTKDIETLNKILKKPSQDAQVTLRRNNYSRSKHKCTTVETLLVEKGRGLKVMRAVELYTVDLVIGISPDVDLNDILGLAVKYDAKERVKVMKVNPGSLASIHLRPGDIIREVNGQPIASKSMLTFWMLNGLLSNRQVRLLIERGAGDDAQVEMPSDVQEIAQKQIALWRGKKIPVPKKSALRHANDTTSRNIIISPDAVEVFIASDHDVTALRHVRKGAE
uniref:PDZ domain-containing protein n=1 Tax=Ascaris lumbricoides TaxID=6252 RepID=A0A0M3HV02_ASCLU